MDLVHFGRGGWGVVKSHYRLVTLFEFISQPNLFVIPVHPKPKGRRNKASCTYSRRNLDYREGFVEDSSDLEADHWK